MHRPQAVGLRAVMLGLLVITLLPSAAAAGRPTGHGPVVPTPVRQMTADAFELARTAKQAVKAGTTDQACTGWRSTVFPPPTVRILRTNSPTPGVNGTVQTVDFRTYVGIVIAAEWPGFYPQEALKAGAVAVKQFAWYYSVVYRGGRSTSGDCYDMQDNTNDQYYQPEKRAPVGSHLKAIASTWGIHLRKTEKSNGRGRFILTGYRSGADVACGSDRDGWRMYQHSVFLCARREGMNMEQILRRYLEPRLEIIAPGTGDVVGTDVGRLTSEVGDVTAIVEGPKGALLPHVWPATLASIGPAGPSGIDLDGPGLLGYAAEDANSDGWYDLVIARHTKGNNITLSVARSNGVDYRDEVTWWSGSIGTDPQDARFFTGDFNGDLRPDAALLVRGVKHAHTLLFFERKKGNNAGYLAPVTWWNGVFDPSVTQVHSGDLTGDGRNDLLFITDLGAEGRKYSVAQSRHPEAGLGSPKRRFLATDLVGDTVKHAVGDLDRNGREDVILVVDKPGRTRIEFLRAKANSGYARTIAWKTALGDKLPFDKLKLSTSDVDYDGLIDVVLYRDRGASGTEIIAFQTGKKARYGVLSPGLDIVDAGADWNTLRPY